MNKMKLIKGDCIIEGNKLLKNSVNLTLTDIPYNEVTRKDNGLRNLNKKEADVLTFEILTFLDMVYRITSSTIIIFCGQRQLSFIYKYFTEKSGTLRQLIWQKSNPSPMNGQHVYLSGIENAVWFKKRGGTFNAHCKNTVFKHPNGRSKLHPTEKNHNLLKELILDNSNKGDIVFDPCMGSGSHGLIALENNRNFIGIELDTNYFKIAQERINKYDT